MAGPDQQLLLPPIDDCSSIAVLPLQLMSPCSIQQCPQPPETVIPPGGHDCDRSGRIDRHRSIMGDMAVARRGRGCLLNNVNFGEAYREFEIAIATSSFGMACQRASARNTPPSPHAPAAAVPCTLVALHLPGLELRWVTLRLAEYYIDVQSLGLATRLSSSNLPVLVSCMPLFVLLPGDVRRHISPRCWRHCERHHRLNQPESEAR